MTTQPLNMQGRGFLEEAWRWVRDRLTTAGELADELFRQPPSATANIGTSGLRGLLVLA